MFASKNRKIGAGQLKIDSIIGEYAEFKGVISLDGTIKIDGKFEGEILSRGNIIVGKNGTVKANINAGIVIIGGKVHGNVIARTKLEMQSTGELYGDIRTPVLVIEEGVVFQGNSYVEKVEEIQDENR